MNQYVEKALGHLTGKQNIDFVSIEELEQLAKDHPYFTVAHVLLAKKLKAAQSAAYLPQVQKTALYFDNPYWLHFQLLDNRPEISFTPKQALEEVHVQEESEHVNESGNVQSKSTGVIEENEETSISEIDEIDKEESVYQENTEPQTAVIEIDGTNKDIAEEEQTITTPVTAGPTIQMEVLDHPAIPDVYQKTTEPREIVSDETVSLTPEETVFVDTATNPFDDLLVQQTAQEEGSASLKYEQQPDVAKDIAVLENPLLSNFSPARQPEETVVQADESAPDREQEVVPDPFHPEVEEIMEEIEQDKADKEETEAVEAKIDAAIASVLDEQKALADHAVPALSENAAAQEPLIPIEPYYTIDYFASQGIKLILEKNPQDKLGQHLKSFTQWLKHMKKLGPEDAIKANDDPREETRIVGIANSSNAPTNIVTEAMAEVLEKQGKVTQAIEIYNKLSFLNPDKRPYFANQIKNLKGN